MIAIPRIKLLALSLCFTGVVQGAQVDILSPAPGDRWCVDSAHTIIWKNNSPAAQATVRLAYTIDGGKNWQEIAAKAPNTGKYLWKVPGTLSAACKIRVMLPGLDVLGETRAAFAIVPSEEVKNYEWVKVTGNAAFAPRDGAGALVHDGKMWFLGGWNPGDKKHFPRICNNEVWSSTDGARWTLVKANTFLDAKFDSAKDWEGRHTAGYATYRGKMWIVGGDVNQGHYHFDVWNSSDGKTWQFVNKGQPVPWGPRALHCTAVFKDRIWVMGGQTVPQFAPGKEVFYRDIWTTTDGVKWERIVPREPCWSARGMIGGSAVFKDRIWVLGGGTYDTPRIPARKFHNDVWSSADGEKWERHTVFAPWEPRQYHEVAVFDGRLWVLEGYSQGKGNRNDVWYSADGVNWYEVPNTPWKARHAASVYVHENALWMVAGNNMESDVWKLQRRK